MNLKLYWILTVIYVITGSIYIRQVYFTPEGWVSTPFNNMVLFVFTLCFFIVISMVQIRDIRLNKHKENSR